MMTMSASDPRALSIFFSLSPGANNQDRARCAASNDDVMIFP
jgi:hypothetical protein